MRSRVSPRPLLLAVTLGLLATSFGVGAAPAAGSTTGSTGPGVSGWWWDALVIDQVHEETTGEGATVVMADGFIDPRVPDLAGADLELRDNCKGFRTEQVSRPASRHGTSMAALVVGTGRGSGPGGQGVAGIAPDAHLDYVGMDARVGIPGLDCKEEIFPPMLQAVEEADGAIVSLSIGNLGEEAKKFQQDVEAAGGVAVAASGDRYATIYGVPDPEMDTPAGFPGWVAVNALDSEAQPADFNPLVKRGYGYTIYGYPTISAPGVDIGSIGWSNGALYSGESQNGTSHATALVAGALALVKSKYPEATGNQLIQHLIHFDTTPEEFGFSDDFGFGIISLLNMMANDPTLWPDLNPLIDARPSQVLKLFPTSIYGKTADEVRADWKAMRGRADPTLAPEPGGPERDASGVLVESAEPAASPARGGSSPWLWVVGGGAVALGLGAGGLVLSRRGRATT